MRLVEIIRRPTGAERDALVGFVESLASSTGTRPLSDHLWLDLRAGGAPGFVAVRAVDDDGSPIGLAQISAANESSSLEVVVAPDVIDRRAVRDDLAETAVDEFRRADGGTLVWWLDDPDDELRSLARSLGLEPGRELLEMRCPLPLPQRASITTRAFVPGADDDAWLGVNNRAFAEHGEQGGWTHETLELRMGEPWFDPHGLRLHEIDTRLAGFCWTKLHTEHDPVLGEIYVIAVDPDFHGRGLGRQLTLAGLDSITDRGVTTANLYVDADNSAAVSLYDGLGFTVHRTRQACSGIMESRPEH